MKNRKFKLAPVMLAAVLLAACGGGGGGGGTPTPTSAPTHAPTLSLTPQSIKTFRLTWLDVSGETEYRLLENPDGSSGYTQVATIAADSGSYNHVTFLPGRINASYILQACNSGGCIDSAPVFVSGSLATAVGYVKASNTGTSDQFGFSVALSADGNTLAVGAHLEDSNATGSNGIQTDNSASGSGVVYVFTRSSSGFWYQQAYVKASNTGVDDVFGYSITLAADGNTLAVGAWGEDSATSGINGNQADNSATNSGAVYVFTRSSGSWSQQAYVKASNTAVNDWFGGVALSADGNTLAVGAFGEDSATTGINGNQADNSATNSGAVYVFTRSGGIWSQQAYVKASNTEAGDYLGYSIALSADGDTLAVGAHLEDSNATGSNGIQADNSASDSGAVYVFTRSGGSWSQQAYVKASNTGVDDVFGYSIALAADGNTLAVGAFGEDSGATGINEVSINPPASNSGAVYLY